MRFGILRMIVSDWEKATALLKNAGYVVNITEVLAVEVADRPGGLAEILEVFENSPINIEYMYAFTFGRGDKAVLIFRFDRPDAAIERLQAAGISVVDSVSRRYTMAAPAQPRTLNFDPSQPPIHAKRPPSTTAVIIRTPNASSMTRTICWPSCSEPVRAACSPPLPRRWLCWATAFPRTRIT